MASPQPHRSIRRIRELAPTKSSTRSGCCRRNISASRLQHWHRRSRTHHSVVFTRWRQRSRRRGLDAVVETSRLHCYNNGIAAAAQINPSYSRAGANEVVGRRRNISASLLQQWHRYSRTHHSVVFARWRQRSLRRGLDVDVETSRPHGACPPSTRAPPPCVSLLSVTDQWVDG